MPRLVVDQTYRMVPIADLEPHPDNPHQGDVDVIAKSIEKKRLLRHDPGPAVADADHCR
ncbi:hypothetical protein [Nonomuraea sp. NPDC050202]|jgi:hypothetical protein|uniref:hypothetical protein n=1 Tax=Nonomuraea sp. NPDC050202 TaxID=3155035 RepID=UPI0033FEA4F1